MMNMREMICFGLLPNLLVSELVDIPDDSGLHQIESGDRGYGPPVNTANGGSNVTNAVGQILGVGLTSGAAQMLVDGIPCNLDGTLILS